MGVEGRKLREELMVPVEGGLAYEVRKGQVQRIVMVDGPQVGDMAVFNAHNYKETFDPDTSYTFNSAQNTGTDKFITYFYSRAPHLRVMFKVLEDRVGTHFVMNGSKCTTKRYEIMGVEGYHPNCFDNLARAIEPYGLTPRTYPMSTTCSCMSATTTKATTDFGRRLATRATTSTCSRRWTAWWRCPRARPETSR